MKFFANKKNIQKIVIMILLIMSFNFVVPKKVQAVDAVGSVLGGIGSFIMDPFLALISVTIDAVFNGVQDFMMGRDGQIFFMVDRSQVDEYYAPEDDAPTVDLEDGQYSGAIWGIGDYKIPVIHYSPEAIFANRVPVLDANFLKSNMRSLPTDDEEGENSMMELRNIVASWYVAIRMMAIVGLLSVLVYLSIRMMMSGVAADKAKYKKMFMDWLVAMCLLFFLHYIMSFAQTISETLIGMIASTGENIINVNVGNGMTEFSTNLIGLVRFRMQSVNVIEQLTYLTIYIMMVAYTVKFTWLYLKRMLTMAFLTLIAPMVALTYPIDKVGDGKAQAFDMWVKEYTYNTLIQPLHCLIYTIFSAATVAVASKNPLLAIVIFPCLSYAEKFLKQMLGFNKASGGSVPGLASSVGAHALGTMVGNLGKAGKGGGKQAQGKVRTNDAGGKRVADKDASKNLEGFEASSASGGDLDFGNSQEFDDGKEEKQKPALASGQGEGQTGGPGEGGQGENPELTEQQYDWQKNNTEGELEDGSAEGFAAGPNEADQMEMDNMQNILDDPEASEEDKAWARQRLDEYNDMYAEQPQGADSGGAPENKPEPETVTEGYTDTSKPKRSIKGIAKGVGGAIGNSMPGRVVGGLASDAGNALSDAWANKGAIARGLGAAGGKAVYKGAKGAAKMALKSTAGVALGAAAFAAGSVLTGDISKGAGLGAAAFAGGYGLAGKGGQAVFGKLGERVEDLAGISGGIKDSYDRRRYGSEIAARNARSDKEFAKSKEFNEYLKYYYTDSDKRKEAREAFMDYRKAGITDLDDIRKAYKTEQKVNENLEKVGGRAVTRDEMINTVKLNKRIDNRAFTDKKVYNAEKDRVANQLFSDKVKNKEAEARRVMSVLQAYRNNN